MLRSDRAVEQLTLADIVEAMLPVGPDASPRPVVMAVAGSAAGWGTLPQHWRVERVADDVSSVQRLLVPEGTDVVLCPPWLHERHLDAETRTRFPRFDLHEAVAAALLPRLPTSTRVVLVLPANTAHGAFRGHVRQQLFADWHPDLVVYVTNRGIFPDIHSTFQLTLIRLLPRGQANNRSRIAAITGDLAPATVRKELARLVRLERGRTRFGYVLERPLPPAASLGFREHHPERARYRDELTRLGPTVPLGKLFNVFKTHYRTRADRRGDQDEGHRGVLVDGRHVTRDGDIVPDPSRVATGSGHDVLQPGDILLRAIYADIGKGLVAAVVPDTERPLIAGNNLLVLRPREPLSEEEVAFVAAYLRSQRADTLLGLDAGQLISVPRLLELPVPRPDAATQQALTDLRNAAALFQRWRDEALTIAEQLFEGDDLDAGRAHVISMGQRVRQRALAASTLDDLGTRLRTRMPYPIAARWRRVQVATPNRDGYEQILECAEVLLCFCAIAGWALARHADIEFPRLAEIRHRFATKGQAGMTFGDWLAILIELAERRDLRRLPRTTPFYEVVEFMRDKDIKNAGRALAQHRNNDRHLRRPDALETPEAFTVAKADLELLLQGAEWLSEYPFRIITKTRRDSLNKITEIAYQELMGDHVIVPTATQRVAEQLDADRLHLVDRLGRHHLLWPLLHAETCPTCHNFTIFVFDRWNSASDDPEYRALDHGHAITVPGSAAALRTVGFLPP
ncbi:hypothetical protein LI90_4289 [Carbonactinospora thermoautotrophica]|uniref:Uncharacterized protein n=1 Tax=Carbonactinospora thermoautotrophica TaxID=1469144 RepID=A0A132MZA9_9ACTN|nr:hypothetical protein LI90_4289 [Carbonactinospora thermoautotrophica]